MNEQFIILAEKLDNVTTLAESITPEVIQQTLGYYATLFYFLTAVFGLITITLFYLAHKEVKKNTLNSEQGGFIFFGIINTMFFIVMSFNTIEITVYPYSWLYTHFLD